jgi:hypothetical protein
MGTYSFLKALRNNPEQCVIDWDSADVKEICKCWYIESAYHKRLPTLKEVAEGLNETKFFGYLSSTYIDSLKALCKILRPYGQNPRLFYEKEGQCQIWCIEFVPGTEDVRVAEYDYIRILDCLPKCPNYDDDLYGQWNTMHKTVEEYCQAECIDSHDWRFENL